MSIRLESNIVGGDRIDLDISVEDDDESVALLIVGQSPAFGAIVFDYYIASPGEVEYFFEVVDKARKSYERLRSR